MQTLSYNCQYKLFPRRLAPLYGVHVHFADKLFVPLDSKKNWHTRHKT